MYLSNLNHKSYERLKLLHTENIINSTDVFYPICSLHIFLRKCVESCNLWVLINPACAHHNFLSRVLFHVCKNTVLVPLCSRVGHVRARKINLAGKKKNSSMSEWLACWHFQRVSQPWERSDCSIESLQRAEWNNRHGTRPEQEVLESVGLSCAFSAAPVGHLLISVAELKRITVCGGGKDRCFVH